MLEDKKQKTPLIAAVSLTKDYPGIRALDGANFELMPGEVHVLFGENGAGKSTLISILAGANQPTYGFVEVGGDKVDLSSVHQARELGISAVFQEFSLIPQMTVAENIFLGAEPTRGGLLQSKEQIERATVILEELDFNLNSNDLVGSLTRAEQQMVEIAKAFRSELSVLILDEPTASLTHHETEHLFKLIEKLKKSGVGIIYITHRMAEIREVGNRISVLRDGHIINTVDAKKTSDNELIFMMTGRKMDEVFPKIDFSPSEKILEVNDLRTKDHSVNGASAYVRRGEIVGFAGLVGSGKSKFARACFGIEPIKSGEIKFKGQVIHHPKCDQMLEAGFLYLPADRRVDGLMMVRSASENMVLPSVNIGEAAKSILIDLKDEKKVSSMLAKRLNLYPNKITLDAEHFSGGNQQKLMLARCLTQEFDLIVFDEPTVGVDVGTRESIYAFIAELCERGAAILLISSDLPEVIHLSHRAYVFYQGGVQAEFSGNDIHEENLLSHFFEREVS